MTRATALVASHFHPISLGSQQQVPYSFHEQVTPTPLGRLMTLGSGLGPKSGQSWPFNR